MSQYKHFAYRATRRLPGASASLNLPVSPTVQVSTIDPVLLVGVNVFAGASSSGAITACDGLVVVSVDSAVVGSYPVVNGALVDPLVINNFTAGIVAVDLYVFNPPADNAVASLELVQLEALT